MELEEEGSKTGNIIAVVFSLVCVVAMCWTVFNNNREKDYLSAGSSSTCGVVYDYVAKDADANTMVLYDCQANGHTYKSYTEDYEFVGCEETKACIGTRFLIVYSVERPEIHRHYFASKCPE